MTSQSRSDDSPPDDRCGGALRADSPEARTVWHVARWYRAKGWTVRTRLPGWGLSPSFHSHMPMLYASDGEREVAIDVVLPGAVPLEEAHQNAFRVWQSSSPQTGRYSLESAHKSGANSVNDEPAGGWIDNGGRSFW